MASKPPSAPKAAGKTVAQRAAEAEVKAAYIVTSPLEHDGVLYAVGDEVELTEAQAAPLLAHTVQPPKAPAPAAPATPAAPAA